MDSNAARKLAGKIGVRYSQHEKCAPGVPFYAFTLDELDRFTAALSQQREVPEGWVLVPVSLLADVEDQLVDLFNEKSSNRGIYRDREKLHDADVLQRVRLVIASAPQPGKEG